MSTNVNLNTTTNGVKPLDLLFQKGQSQKTQAENFFFTQKDDYLLSLSDEAKKMIEEKQKEMEKVQKTINDMWKKSGMVNEFEDPSTRDLWPVLMDAIRDKIEERLGKTGQTYSFDNKEATAKLTEQVKSLTENAMQKLKDTGSTDIADILSKLNLDITSK